MVEVSKISGDSDGLGLAIVMSIMSSEWNMVQSSVTFSLFNSIMTVICFPTKFLMTSRSPFSGACYRTTTITQMNSAKKS